MPKPTGTTAVITIGSHTLELPQQEARDLFGAAVLTGRRSTSLAISPDTAVWITPNTELSLTLIGGFTEAYDPAQCLADLTQATKKRGAVLG